MKPLSINFLSDLFQNSTFKHSPLYVLNQFSPFPRLTRRISMKVFPPISFLVALTTALSLIAKSQASASNDQPFSAISYQCAEKLTPRHKGSAVTSLPVGTIPEQTDTAVLNENPSINFSMFFYRVPTDAKLFKVPVKSSLLQHLFRIFISHYLYCSANRYRLSFFLGIPIGEAKVF